jgi:hypothetical protein
VTNWPSRGRDADCAAPPCDADEIEVEERWFEAVEPCEVVEVLLTRAFDVDGGGGSGGAGSEEAVARAIICAAVGVELLVGGDEASCCPAVVSGAPSSALVGVRCCDDE